MTAAEEAAILRVIHRYAHGLDDRDIEAVLSCFGPDAHIEYDGGAIVLSGRDALATYLTTEQGRPPMHFFSNFLAEPRAGHVAVRASALISTMTDPAIVTVRGVAYRFLFQGEGENWSIVQLRHCSQWALDAAAAFGAPG